MVETQADGCQVEVVELGRGDRRRGWGQEEVGLDGAHGFGGGEVELRGSAVEGGHHAVGEVHAGE